MRSKSKTNGLCKALGCLLLCAALIVGMAAGGNFGVAFAAEAEEALAPTIISVAGIAIGSSNMGNFPAAIVGEEYRDSDGQNYKIMATGTGTLTYSAREYETEMYGRMPQGLHLDSKTGEFYGTITSAGTFGVSVTVSNEYGSTNAMCWISVYNESDKPTITTETLSDGAVGSSYYQELSYTGVYQTSVAPKIVSGALPAGLTFGMQNFSPTIYGKPTEKGTFTFTVSINNGAGTATKEYTMEITDEAVRPYLLPSATTVNESDKYSYIEGGSSLYIHVVKGKEVNVQLVSSGTNTADNPTIYELFGTNGVLPDGLTMSESGLITGIPSNDIETSGGKKQFNTYIRVGNKTVSGSPQGSATFIDIVVHDDGYVDWINIDPKSTSVAKGETRQFEIVWKGYGDVDKDDVTWYFNLKPASEDTTLSDTGLLTLGMDETHKYLYVRVRHNASGRFTEAIVTVVDHTHATELVERVDKTCETDGNIQHYRCTICGALFEDALATKTITADQAKISAGHDYGTLIPKQNATCSAKGTEAHFECSACHKIFDSSKAEKTAAELEFAIDNNAHRFGTWQNEKSANCATEGTKAHKDCEYCGKHFDQNGTEMTDLTIQRNDEHLAQDTWSKDSSGHWHACTRDGCKDGGKIDVTAHTKSAEEASETSDVHCTVCEYVLEAVKGHTHNLKMVAGHAKACYNDGVKTYWICLEGDHPCGKCFEDSAGSTEITEDLATWKVIPAGHTFGEWIAEVPATVDDFGVKAHQDCTLCHKHFDAKGSEQSDDDLKIAKLTAPATPTTPDKTDKPGNTDKPDNTENPDNPDVPSTPNNPDNPDVPNDPAKPDDPKDPDAPDGEKKTSLSGGAIAAIVIGIVVVAGLGGFALFWFVVKKRRGEDLAAAFKNMFAKK